jgi:hypothetical protein
VQVECHIFMLYSHGTLTTDFSIASNLKILDISAMHIYRILLRKEVIQPHLPIRLPCYDFTPIIGPTFGSALLSVMLLTSGVTDSHGVTGGVYKTRERIHCSMLTCNY